MTHEHDVVRVDEQPVVMSAWRTRLWPVGLVYSALAIWAVFTNAGSHYIGDNRFEQYVNPARRLAKSFGVWDPTRGLGAPREDAWPGTTIPGAVFRALGMSPWAAERMFHAICLVTMALGVTALVRLFRPRLGVEHIVAGLYAGFGPYSAAFLVPSNLYYMMALGPWLVVAMVRGLTGTRPWRWAGVFALLVAWAGNPDPPGLIYNGIILIIAAVYLVLVERAVRWRDVAKWTAGTVSLAVLCSAWTLAKTFYARDMLNARLIDTELPSVSALTSSSSESLRGLGNWLSYFRDQGILMKPQGVTFFMNALVVSATFAVPLVALLALWRVRWRAKVFFAAMALVSLAVVVSGFASPSASPIGAGILWLMEHVTLISSFRNTYKAGGGIAIGIGVLAGIGVAHARDVLASRGRWWRRLPAACAAVTLMAVSFPFWTGTLYHPAQQVVSVPKYWTDAFSYLDHLPDDGLTAVVPAITRANYRWGWVGDDIFDALLARPHAMSTGVPLSSPLGANALETFTMATQSVPYRQGVVASLARRLGITEIVIRNDLRWDLQNLPRPSLYDGLRHDPEFQLISSFGPVGVGVVPYRDHSNAAIRERRLPPVEIYKLRSPGSLARTVDAKPIILAGDTNAWPNLHGDGLVDTYQPLVTSGAIADADIASELTASRGVVVTDTGRRRLRRLISYEPTYSFTLGRSQQTGRTVRELFPAVPTAESTAWFADASDISPVGMGVSGISTWASPGNAFDGDPSTYWGVNWALAPGTPGIKVTFRAPHVLSRLDLTALLSADGVSSIQRAVIVLSDGSRHKVSFDATGSAHLSFAPTSTSSLLVMLDQVDAHQGFVGLTEVSVPGVDLRQFVEPGTDLFGGRAAAPELTAVMASTPTVYSFQRSARASYLDDPNYAASRFDEEHALRRRFTVVHTGRYQVQGTLRLTGLTPDTKLNGVVGGAVSATASASNPTDSSGQPMHALDGLLTSAWIAKRPIGEHITVAVPRQRVQRVQVISDSDGAGAAISVITVTVAGVSHSMMMNPDPWCPAYTLADLAAIKLRQQQVGPQPAEAPSEVTKQPCHRTATLDLPEPVDADQVQVSLDATDRRANPFGVEGHVDEVRVSGPDHTAAENTVDLAAPVDGSCVDLGLRIARSPVAGAGYPIPLSFHTTVGDLLTGVPVKFTGCSPASLSSGVDYLDSGPNGWIDSVALVSADWPAAASSDASTSTPVPVRFQGSGVADTRVSTTQATTFVLGQSFDPLWTLSVDGGKPVAASAVDGLNGWPLPAGTHDLVLRYRPEWGLSVAILVTLASVIACVVLVIGRRRRPVLADGADLADDHVAVGVVTRRASTIAVVLATLVGVSLVGVWALLVGVVVLAVVRFYDEPVDVTGVAAPVLFALAGATSVVMLFTGSNPLSLQYPKDRSLAHHFTVVAMVFAVQTVALLSLSARAAVRRHVVFGPRRGISDVARSWWHAVERPWAVCALVVGAAAARVLVSGHASSTASADQLVRNIRLGSEYTSAVFTGPLAVDLAPLAPTVRAMLRLTPALLAAVTMVCTMAALVVWARRRLPAVPSWQVAVVCLVSPLTWGVGLGGQLAALAVVSAALLLDVERPSTGAVAAAGLFLGAAVLARPDAVLLWLVVIVWMLRRHRFVHASIVTVVGVLTIAPWANNVWSAGSAPWLAGSVRAMVLDQAVTGVARWSTWWVALLFVAVLLVVLQRRGARTQALAAEQ